MRKKPDKAVIQTHDRSKQGRPVILLALFLFLFLFILTGTAPSPLRAGTVELPLVLNSSLLQRTLEQTLNLQSDGRVVVYQQDRNNYLHIREPKLVINNGQTLIKCRASASAGFESLLPSTLSWDGSLMMNLDFYVDQAWQLRYRIIDSAVYDRNGAKGTIAGFVWKLSKKYLHPLLERFSFDLTLPRQEILTLLRSCTTAENLNNVNALLNTIRPGKLRPGDDELVVPLLLSLAEPVGSAAPPSPVQKPLSKDEIGDFLKVFEPLDAFVVFTVKTAGSGLIDSRQRQKLFELILNIRYQLIPILAGTVYIDSEDPLRALFIDAWQQLKSIIESSGGQQGLMQEQLLRYMTFVSAGDALLMLDAAAPQLGMRITTDGLRRLARILRPDSVEDPLHFDWDIDPILQQLFNFLPEPKPEADKMPLTDLLMHILIGTAHAEQTEPVISPELSRRMDRWLPKADDLTEYQTVVGKLLNSIALNELDRNGLDPVYRDIYLKLVPATALMESCWKHYALKKDKIWFLSSQSGSVGMMQINPHVWRGFYNIHRLKWEPAYNVLAGTRILLHYFTDYGLPIANETGKAENAGRAAYAAYNAGPRGARRFLKADATSRQKKVDGRLQLYLLTLISGGRVNLATCGVAEEGS